jgi:hypothetical protein
MDAEFNHSKRKDKQQEPYFFPLYMTTAKVVFGLTTTRYITFCYGTTALVDLGLLYETAR